MLGILLVFQYVLCSPVLTDAKAVSLYLYSQYEEMSGVTINMTVSSVHSPSHTCIGQLHSSWYLGSWVRTGF